MVVWLNQHQITLFWGDVLFYDSACLIVHDIQFDAISFSMEQFILLFICHEDDVVAKAHYGKGHDCICLVVVNNKEADISHYIKGNETVRSLYNVPVRLSTNAVKQNTLASCGIA